MIISFKPEEACWLHPGQEPKATAGRSTSPSTVSAVAVYVGAPTYVRLPHRSCCPCTCLLPFSSVLKTPARLSLRPIISLHITQPTAFTCSRHPLQVCKALSNVRTYRRQFKWFHSRVSPAGLGSPWFGPDRRFRPALSGRGGLHLSPSAGDRRRECLTCWILAAPLAPSRLDPRPDGMCLNQQPFYMQQN